MNIYKTVPHCLTILLHFNTCYTLLTQLYVFVWTCILQAIISAVMSYPPSVKTEIGVTDINFIIIMPFFQHEIKFDWCWNCHRSWAMNEHCLRSHIFGNICMFWFIEDTHQNSDHFVLFPESTKQCQHWICVAALIWTFTPYFCCLLHWEYGVKKVATHLQYHLVYVFVTKRGCLYHKELEIT
jgi:hypothetical protein